MNCFLFLIVVKFELVGSHFVSHVLNNNGMFCVRVDCDKNHRGPGAYKAMAGDIHIISKQGEAYIQPKVNTRDMNDELVSEWIVSRESM